MYLSVRNNDTVAVMDGTTGALLEMLPFGVPKGVYADTSLGSMGMLFVSASSEGTGTVRAVALDAAHTPLWSASVEGCDILKFDAVSRLLFVTADEGLVVLDPATGARVGPSIALPSAEDFYLSPSSEMVFVSGGSGAPTSVFAVSRTARALVSTWSIAPFYSNPYASHLDSPNARLLLSAQGNATVAPAFLVLDVTDGHIVWSWPTGNTFCDGVYQDVAARFVYVTCAGDQRVAMSGSVVVFSQRGADSFAYVGSVSTPTYARMGFFDALTGRLFVGVPALAPGILTGGATQNAALLIFSRAVAPSPQPLPTPSPQPAGDSNPVSPGVAAAIACGVTLAVCIAAAVVISRNSFFLQRAVLATQPTRVISGSENVWPLC